MNFFWHPDAERVVKNMGLNPSLRRIKDTFARFDFDSPSREFGSTEFVDQGTGQLRYQVVFRVEPGVSMDSGASDELITELVVTCMRTPVKVREHLKSKEGELYLGLVLDVSKPSDHIKEEKEESLVGGFDEFE